MNHSLLRFGAVALLLANALAPSSVAAKIIAPQGAGFSVSMPGNPSFFETTHKSFVGAVKERTYTVNGGKATYSVSYSELPGLAVSLGGSETILKKAKEGLLKEAGGTETSFQESSLGGSNGKSLAFTLPSGAIGRARLYLVDKILYVVVGSGPASAIGAIQRFLSSFKLTS